MPTELSGRPLLDTAADARLYVPRAVDDELLRNAEAGINTLLVGERGAGKTSALRHLAHELRERGRSATFVNAGPVQDLLELLNVIRFELGQAPTPMGQALRTTQSLFAPTMGLGGESAAAVEIIRSLQRPANAGERVIVLLDSLRAPKLAHALFGRLRDELWQTPLRFVVSADAAESTQFLTPPADVFFEEVLALGALTPEEQHEFIQRRLGRQAHRRHPGLEQLDEGNPRRLLALLRSVVDAGTPAQALATARSAREARVAELGRAASALVGELEERGPLSASDPELLERLGWTRQRAAQVFAQLEQAGLVRGERQSGPSGRPRRIFTLTDPPVPV